MHTEQGAPRGGEDDVPIVEIERGVVHERLLVDVDVDVIRVGIGLEFGALPGVVVFRAETGICHGETALRSSTGGNTGVKLDGGAGGGAERRWARTL